MHQVVCPPIQYSNDLDPTFCNLVENHLLANYKEPNILRNTVILA